MEGTICESGSALNFAPILRRRQITMRGKQGGSKL